MNIALLGYGKMGQAIEAALKTHSRRHDITLKTTSREPEFSSYLVAKTDVAIEFSTPQTAVANIEKCLRAGVPIVVGTTGWYGRFDYVRDLVRETKGALLHGTNFSIGMNLMFHLNERLAELTQDLPFEVSVEETHHTEKKDSPSGTALTLAEGIIERRENLTDWIENPLDGETSDRLLPIYAKREAGVFGLHRVAYRNAQEQLCLEHEAFSRSGFAQGAILAAEWLQGKSGVFRFGDVLGL